MKQLFILILFLPLLGCGNIIKNKQTSIDFNCPRVFFSSDDRIYIDNSISLDDITIRAEFNNYAINTKCQQQENIAVIPLDILIVAKPLSNLEEPILSLPVYISLLNDNDEILETQYFSVSGVVNKNNESNKGKKWSNEEISDLTTEFMNKTPISEIADSHKRSERAIELQGLLLASKMLKEKSIEESRNKT